MAGLISVSHWGVASRRRANSAFKLGAGSGA